MYLILKVIAVLGHKKSGKTRLSTMLIRSLSEMGYSVASAKHVHHADFSVDQVGKDSWKHGEAGANPNIIISPTEIAVIWRKRTINSIEELKNFVGNVDFLILEGFYSLVKRYREAVKIVLVKNREDAVNLENIIVASFEEINDPDVIKLPEQFPQLLKIIVER
ncbi:MAG: molybdopterin-guanine dinucleotide biosynthesis protein B [Nitrososphaerota archaeon]